METLTINIKKKGEVSIIKKILQVFDVEIVENTDKEITNPELLKRLEKHFDHYDNPVYKKENYKTVNPDKIWETIMSK